MRALPRLLLAVAIVLAVPPALTVTPRDYHDCTSCVAVGYGWSITKQQCGGFKNKQCAKPRQPVDDYLQAFTEPTSSVAEKLAAKRAHEAAQAALAETAAGQTPQPSPSPSTAREQTPEELAREAYLHWLAMMVVGVFVLTLLVGYLARDVCVFCRRRGAGIPMDAATVKLDVRKILFVQASIDDKFRDGRTVQSMIEQLTAGSLSANHIPAIRVVRKHGCYFTLDHRRLYALRQGLGSNKMLADRTVTCILESFNDEEIVKEFKRKATTENPTGITVNSLWLADWKPFVEATPPSRKFRSPSADDSDVDLLTFVGGGRVVTSPTRKSPKAALEAARQTALSKKFDEVSSSSEEDEDEEEEEVVKIEREPEPEPEPEPERTKAPKGFAPKFAEPTVNEAAIAAKPSKPLTNYEAAFLRFQQIDNDGDGKITVAELVSLGMTEEQARQEIGAHDTDGDGCVSWSEYLEKKKQESLAKPV